ncbi:unnamed protein product [Cuscuta europaea]|nr:unnamed protein product [Cuscuta europaea]
MSSSAGIQTDLSQPIHPNQATSDSTVDGIEVHNLDSDNDRLNEDEPIANTCERKLKSKVWDDMERVKIGSVFVAICKHCHKRFAGGSKSGTSHLIKHISNCIHRKIRSGAQQVLQLEKNALNDNVKVATFKFDQLRSRMDFARALVKHNYPFNMVEHEYFEKFLNNLQPNFKLVSRNTVRADVIKLYQEEKEKLYKTLEEFDGMVSMTTDIWTSDHQNLAYACLTCHYISEDWELKKKIIAFGAIPYPHDGETLFRFISDILLEWNLDKKLSSVVVDNASANDSMIKYLKLWLLDKSLIHLGGDLFHVRCSAHILNLIVQDGLSIVGSFLQKIRDTMKYLKRSTSANQKFESAINQCKLKNKKRVSLDVCNR